MRNSRYSSDTTPSLEFRINVSLSFQANEQDFKATLAFKVRQGPCYLAQNSWRLFEVVGNLRNTDCFSLFMAWTWRMRGEKWDEYEYVKRAKRLKWICWTFMTTQVSAVAQEPSNESLIDLFSSFISLRSNYSVIPLHSTRESIHV